MKTLFSFLIAIFFLQQLHGQTSSPNIAGVWQIKSERKIVLIYPSSVGFEMVPFDMSSGQIDGVSIGQIIPVRNKRFEIIGVIDHEKSSTKATSFQVRFNGRNKIEDLRDPIVKWVCDNNFNMSLVKRMDPSQMQSVVQQSRSGQQQDVPLGQPMANSNQQRLIPTKQDVSLGMKLPMPATNQSSPRPGNAGVQARPSNTFSTQQSSNLLTKTQKTNSLPNLGYQGQSMAQQHSMGPAQIPVVPEQSPLGGPMEQSRQNYQTQGYVSQQSNQINSQYRNAPQQSRPGYQQQGYSPLQAQKGFSQPAQNPQYAAQGYAPQGYPPQVAQQGYAPQYVQQGYPQQNYSQQFPGYGYAPQASIQPKKKKGIGKKILKGLGTAVSIAGAVGVPGLSQASNIINLVDKK